MITADKYYIENIKKCLYTGQKDEDPRPKYKDGTPAYSCFITQVFETYHLSEKEFPIPTLRNTAIKTGIQEILWIYQDQSNSLETAHKRGISWWDDFDIGDGTIGHRYGYTVKKYNLINRLLDNLIKNPFSRRHIINLYQEQDISETTGLYPCLYETIWSVRKSNGYLWLDMTAIQRSQDYLIAGPINRIQYAALQMMVAAHCNYRPGKFCHFTQNLHIYDRHIDEAQNILKREAFEVGPSIQLKNKDKSFFEFTIDDFIIDITDNVKNRKQELELAV